MAIPAPIALDIPPAAAGGWQSALNVSGAANLIKPGVGRCVRISVVTAGSAAGAAYDAATPGAAAASNQFAAIPNAVGVIVLDWPIANGLVITPGTGQVLAVSYI